MKHSMFGHKKIIIEGLTALLALTLFLNTSWALHPQTGTAQENGSCPVTLLENKDLFPALMSVIDGAKSEILICMFSFKAGVHPDSYPDRIVAALARAAHRGVRVKVVLETTGDKANDLTVQNLKTKNLLEEKGVMVYLDSPKKTTHTKLILVDERIVLLGSHNFTSSALMHNNEISILIDRPELAKKVRQYIFKIIKEAK
jgi:phosphatidylserine/phosphatidylglycerophosphate/cardiolipin synthase-like enzyme